MKIYRTTALILLIGSLYAIPASSQSTLKKDTLTSVSNFWGTKYYLGQERKTMKQVTELMRNNQEANVYWKRAKSQLTFGTIIGAIAGGLIGYSLGSAAGGEKLNAGVLGAGAGLLIPAIVLGVGANKNGKKAFRTYNASLY